MINLKTKHEIDLMARAGQLLASVLPPLAAACEPGTRTCAYVGRGSGIVAFSSKKRSMSAVGRKRASSSEAGMAPNSCSSVWSAWSVVRVSRPAAKP